VNRYMIVFRIIHISSAILWAGSAVFFTAFVGPTVETLGPEAGRFLNHLVRQRKAVIFFLVVSTLTVVAGGFLYWRLSGGLNIDWIQTGVGTGFTVGAVAGLISWLLVVGALAPTAYRLTALGQQLSAAGGPRPGTGGLAPDVAIPAQGFLAHHHRLARDRDARHGDGPVPRRLALEARCEADRTIQTASKRCDAF
jgi:hypothetical protein